MNGEQRKLTWLVKKDFAELVNPGGAIYTRQQSAASRLRSWFD